MIKAKMVKAVRTEDGVTYTLKGPIDKAALHEAVDMQDADVVISAAQLELIQDEKPDTWDAIMTDMQHCVRRLASWRTQVSNQVAADLLTMQQEKENETCQTN